MTDDGKNKGSTDGKEVDTGSEPDKKPDIDTVSIDEYKALQAQMLEMSAKFEVIEKEKTDIQKNAVMAQLKGINPKLAEINKDAELSTLNAVLISANAMNTGFKAHKDDKKDDGQKELTGAKRWDFSAGKWMRS